jgi:hypothetical protein
MNALTTEANSAMQERARLLALDSYDILDTQPRKCSTSLRA